MSTKERTARSKPGEPSPVSKGPNEDVGTSFFVVEEDGEHRAREKSQVNKTRSTEQRKRTRQNNKETKKQRNKETKKQRNNQVRGKWAHTKRWSHACCFLLYLWGQWRTKYLHDPLPMQHDTGLVVFSIDSSLNFA